MHRPELVLNLPASVALGVSYKVFVNDNRWLVQCPGCLDAQLAVKSDPRFFCVKCLNVDVGGQWVKVAWPDTQTLADIEDVLSARPLHVNRHWLPSESVADLINQNDQHNVG